MAVKLAWIESDIDTEENSMKYEPKTNAGFCDPSLNRQAYCWKPIIKEWTLERPMSHQTPWSVSNPPNICWIPEDLQEFQETLSAMALFLGFDSSTQSLKATAIGAEDLQAVWFCMVMGLMGCMMCTCVVRHDGHFNFFHLTPPRLLATHIFPTTSTFNSNPMLFSSQMSSPIRFTSSTAQGGGGSFKNRKRIGEIDCCEWQMSEQKHWPTE